MVHQNSLLNWGRIKHEIKPRHLKVMGALHVLGQGTIYDVAEYLNVGVHTISGRITELSGNDSTHIYLKPLIEPCGEKKNRYSNMCTVWRIKVYQQQAEQIEIF